MVQLTAELIMNSHQSINPLKDRQLDLRSYNIPLIENLDATFDQFDTIDFSDNVIKKVNGFPSLRRLKNLLFNNNVIVHIADNVEKFLPNLESLILTGNAIKELEDLDPLASLLRLKMLSLINNPVSFKNHYRLYVAHKIPQVRLLDFKKISLKEYEAAGALFGQKKLEEKLVKKPIKLASGKGLKSKTNNGYNEEDKSLIINAISEIKSLEEIEYLTKSLQAGEIPNKKQKGYTETLYEVKIEKFDDDDNKDNIEVPAPME